MGRSNTFVTLLVVSCFAALPSARAEGTTNAAAVQQVTVSIDARVNRRPINPMIYGVNFGSQDDLLALNAPFNRFGGNSTSTYNWLQNAWNLAADWYYESYPRPSAMAGAEADNFIAATRRAGSAPMITVPMTGWVAKLGPGRAILPSFSVAKYGAQQATDPFFPNAGNGVRPSGVAITGNDPNDAYVRSNPNTAAAWLRHLIAKWGGARAGGVRYYGTDNEASIWHGSHRDIWPVGLRATAFRDLGLSYSATIKATDPGALVMGPEEWGWLGLLYSGFDQQSYARNGTLPDRNNVLGGRDYLPWLLSEWKKRGRPVDVVSVHFYPQANEFSDDVSVRMQLLRNRSTRQLWDPRYVSESWIDAVVNLVPRLHSWVKTYYYAGTPLALTEYNWGAENHINGATAQADLLGIFGREGLAMAARWTVPPRASPTFKAMQIYRNYDGRKSAFGNISVSARVPNPDTLAAFAAERSRDGALTVVVINKALGEATNATFSLSNFGSRGTAETYQLTEANQIKRLANRSFTSSRLVAALPPQSITLFVLRKT